MDYHNSPIIYSNPESCAKLHFQLLDEWGVDYANNRFSLQWWQWYYFHSFLWRTIKQLSIMTNIATNLIVISWQSRHLTFWKHLWKLFCVIKSKTTPSVSSRPSYWLYSPLTSVPCFSFSNVFFSFLFSQEMRQQFDIRRLSLEEQRNHLQQQLETIREELTTKLNMANQEVHIQQLLVF